MEKRKFWTEEEEIYLIKNYPTQGKACAAFLNKTEQAVFAKANKLGLISKAAKPSRAKTSEEYDQELLVKELDFLRLEPYINNKTPILHECVNEHQWKATPTHILSGHGCPECAGNKRRSTEQYKNLIKFEVLEPYINKETPILHKCPEGHIWKARPGHIIRGSNCPSCSKSGFDPNKPAILYYVKISKNYETYYKIGITNGTVLSRFKTEKDKTIISIFETYYEIGHDAYFEEQSLLNTHREERQNIPGFLASGGNTELFEYDVLGLEHG